MSGAKPIILDLAREESLPWLLYWLAVFKMFVCIAVPFRLNHVIVAGDGNEQVWLKLSDYLSSHLMLGRDGLQIFIICFQTIHIDNLIDGEDGEHKRQIDAYPGIDITIPFVAWFIEHNMDALFYFVPTVYKLILQRVWHMIIIIWNGASLLVNCPKHLPIGKFPFFV